MSAAIESMTMLRSSRSMRRAGRVFVLTLFLLIAQLGIATHPLHFDAKQSGQKIELTCGFCLASSSFGLAPAAPVIHFNEFISLPADVSVRNVVDLVPLSTPRLTRGPPISKA